MLVAVGSGVCVSCGFSVGFAAVAVALGCGVLVGSCVGVGAGGSGWQLFHITNIIPHRISAAQIINIAFDIFLIVCAPAGYIQDRRQVILPDCEAALHLGEFLRKSQW